MVDALEQLEKQLADVQKSLDESSPLGGHVEELDNVAEQEVDEGELLSLDFDAGLAVVSGDRDTYLFILKTFQEEHSDNLQQIEKSLAAEDFQTAADIVHTLKGVTPAIGAQRLADITKRFNDTLVSSDKSLLPDILQEMQLEFPRLLDAIFSVFEAGSGRNEEKVAVFGDAFEMAQETEKLSLLIKTMDMDSGKCAATFIAQLEQQGYLEPGEGDALQAGIHDFDFDRALEELALLRRKIERGTVVGVK